MKNEVICKKSGQFEHPIGKGGQYDRLISWGLKINFDATIEFRNIWSKEIGYA